MINILIATFCGHKHNPINNFFGKKKVIKAAHIRSIFSKTIVSQEIFTSIGLRKNMFQNFENFGCRYNDIYIFAYDFANVGMKPDRNG